MLEPGRQAAEVLVEYVRAARQLGHATPDPTALFAAYTAEELMDLTVLAADCRAVTVVAEAAGDALGQQDSAGREVGAAWQGVGAQTAAGFLHRHTKSSGRVVDGLRCAAAALADLLDRLPMAVRHKVETTCSIEARGSRELWLAAARTVSTGVGDRPGASELVDLRVAPFVADDIGVDWASAMRRTEEAVRQAYAAAAAEAAPPPPVFHAPGIGGPVAVQENVVSWPAAAPAGPVLSSPVLSSPAPPSPAPAGFAAAAPMVEPAPAAAAVPPAPDAMAGGAPLPAAGAGLGGTPAFGSGLSGLGQPFADLLGGLLDPGSAGWQPDSADADSPLAADDTSTDDEAAADETHDDEFTDEETADDEDADETHDDETQDDETRDDETQDDGAPDDEVVAEAPPPADPGIPTPVPESMPGPAVEPADPAPAEPTPCEIAADELPQAGP